MSFWGERYGVGSGPANPWNPLVNFVVIPVIVYVILGDRKIWQLDYQREAITARGSNLSVCY